jgi:catechol 2,3-dioxygenase-like lactoylglutathione lyase family enzyme
MTSFVAHTTVDCHHAYELSEWWKQVLGYVDVEGDPNEPGHEECMVVDPGTGHAILFIEVPDAELPAKRIHFDVRPRAGTRDEEVERVRALGAVQLDDQRDVHGPGTGWVVFADPEGNQFCVLRSQGEIDAAAAAATTT